MMAKHARDMTDDEAAKALQEAKRGKPAAAAPPAPHPRLLWDQVAATIRGWTDLDIRAFSQTYGISIVSQDTKKLRRYSAMTPEEQAEFRTLHGISDKHA